MNIQNPSWYSSLKSISILYAHSHTGLLDGHFPLRSLIKICSQLTSLLRMPHSLHIFPLFSDKLVYDKQYKLWNYTLSILLHPFPLSLTQTLFWLLCSQRETAYKGQKALHSNKTDHKPHFILHTNYVFQQHGAIFMEFITNKWSYVQHIIQGPVTLTFIKRIKS